jgi:hypothetical protein
VAFDEYDAEQWPGAKLAVDEFLDARDEAVQLERDETSGKYFATKMTT